MSQSKLDFSRDVNQQPAKYKALQTSGIDPITREVTTRYGIFLHSANGLRMCEDHRTEAFAKARAEALNSGRVTLENLS